MDLSWLGMHQSSRNQSRHCNILFSGCLFLTAHAYLVNFRGHSYTEVENSPESGNWIPVYEPTANCDGLPAVCALLLHDFGHHCDPETASQAWYCFGLQQYSLTSSVDLRLHAWFGVLIIVCMCHGTSEYSLYYSSWLLVLLFCMI